MPAQVWCSMKSRFHWVLYVFVPLFAYELARAGHWTWGQQARECMEPRLDMDGRRDETRRSCSWWLHKADMASRSSSPWQQRRQRRRRADGKTKRSNDARLRGSSLASS
ncbi:hypothetical protein B0T10DRAFT_470000 [Thelonectria olida]|uniref:Secreted protein n=1 Tax=Thelonectria olida TaxID=1576542 RepID=A0A9P8WKQ6_9HYPO|nr:hypothetical protein B0T10DRAFT_470000 [Thelonectria olida]